MPELAPIARGEDRPATIALLGAEKQAASSAALAYPEIEFSFVSDHPVIDGWDLPNVQFRAGSPERFENGAEALPLCPRWMKPGRHSAGNRLADFRLRAVFAALAENFGDWVLPVARTPGARGHWIVKGDSWHRPDFTVSGSGPDVAQVDDPHGCGVVFQPLLPPGRTLLAVGRSYGNSNLATGLFEVHGEAQCREAMLLAAETIREPDLLERVAAICRSLDHRGFFSMNWIVSEGRLLLTSMRPVPRAVFGALRNAGIDLLAQSSSGLAVARAGVKMIASQHYSEYRRLGA
jgi:hypothetical protein